MALRRLPVAVWHRRDCQTRKPQHTPSLHSHDNLGDPRDHTRCLSHCMAKWETRPLVRRESLRFCGFCPGRFLRPARAGPGCHTQALAVPALCGNLCRRPAAALFRVNSETDIECRYRTPALTTAEHFLPTELSRGSNAREPHHHAANPSRASVRGTPGPFGKLVRSTFQRWARALNLNFKLYWCHRAHHAMCSTTASFKAVTVRTVGIVN